MNLYNDIIIIHPACPLPYLYFPLLVQAAFVRYTWWRFTLISVLILLINLLHVIRNCGRDEGSFRLICQGVFSHKQLIREGQYLWAIIMWYFGSPFNTSPFVIWNDTSRNIWVKGFDLGLRIRTWSWKFVEGVMWPYFLLA